MLAKLYIEVLGLSPGGQDALRMLKYRTPKTNSTSTGRLPLICCLLANVSVLKVLVIREKQGCGVGGKMSDSHLSKISVSLT